MLIPYFVVIAYLAMSFGYWLYDEKIDRTFVNDDFADRGFKYFFWAPFLITGLALCGVVAPSILVYGAFKNFPLPTSLFFILASIGFGVYYKNKLSVIMEIVQSNLSISLFPWLNFGKDPMRELSEHCSDDARFEFFLQEPYKPYLWK